MRATRKSMMTATAVATGAILVLGSAAPAIAGTGPGHGGDRHTSVSQQLQRAVSAHSIEKRLRTFQWIADRYDGNRAAGTEGHEKTAAYIEKLLKRAGYSTERQPFSYEKVNIDRAEFSQVSPDPVDYVLEDEFYPMDYSGEGAVEEGAVTPVDINLDGDRASTSGCEAEDFAGFPAGDIALVQRGSCDFATKAANAEAAGASAVVVFNQGNDVPGDDRFGVIFGTLGELGIGIPVLGTSFEIGETLATATDPTVSIVLETTTVTVDTFNLLARSKKGDPTEQVVVGAHLDSVAEGPGINDNGTGSATILEVALKLAKLKAKPANQLVFAWWSGEEDGLQGSDYYVSQLGEEGVANTALNLNFDMVGSPNPVRFVYDGDGSEFGDEGPEGSAEIEATFVEHFASKGLETAPTEFDGRSDYAAFIDAGIPAGGLFTGAEGIKTEEEAAIFGGTAGEPYDPCYHQACDTKDNVDGAVLGQMADAVAHAVATFGSVSSWGWGWHGHHGHDGSWKKWNKNHGWDGRGFHGSHGGDGKR
ncbi:M28 family peptidase [Homoserinibacter sp. GY 40078]|uniref:M28 family peptidase n=1 Tax=Homoserinibacter sp. GY 40078 TaxID=2603275 RepID=UPI0011CBC76E|nr:M28 family peptidase [Homoserinibacter sp. GY 40078]TXK16352.1 M28 family peptidase [Homoserinibacter sp. GY 40078]